MFYNYSIGLYEEKGGYVDDNGMWVDNKVELVEELKCDIQPITNDLVFQQFGYEGDVEYKIYCPYSNLLKLNKVVKIENRGYFKIVAMKHWEDYSIIVVSDRNDSN